MAEKLAELEAGGIPVSLDEINRRYHDHGRDPDGNAAPVYQRAFAEQVSVDLPVEEFTNALQGAAQHHPIDSEQMEAIAEVVPGNQEAIRLYQEAAQYPYLRFQLDFTKGDELVLPHVSRIRNGARLLAGKAILAAERGNLDDAAEAISAIFGLAIHLSEEPGIISQLSRVVIERFGRIALEQILARVELSSPLLASLQSSVHAAEIAPRMIPAFEGELAKTEWYFKQIEEGVPFEDDISGPLKKASFFFYRASGRITRDQQLFVTRMEELLTLVKLPHAERLQVDWDGVVEISGQSAVGEILAGIIIPSMGRVVDSDTRSVTYLRTTRIGLATERYRSEHGNFPLRPGDLTPAFLDEMPEDPYGANGAFEFAVEDDAFYVRGNGTVERRNNGGGIPIQFALPVER